MERGIVIHRRCCEQSLNQWIMGASSEWALMGTTRSGAPFFFSSQQTLAKDNRQS